MRRAMLALMLLALAVAVTACGGGKKIDASTLIDVRFEGLNGEGRAILSFNKARLTEVLSQEKALTERQMEALDALGNDLQKDYSVSKREALSNGDTVEITGGLDKDLLKDLGFGINNDTAKLTVEGLIDPIELNAADYVRLDVRGFNGYGEVYAYFDTEAFAKAIAARWAELKVSDDPYGYENLDSYYSCAYGVQVTLDKTDGYANGDAVEPAITVEHADIPECGVTVVAGEYSGTVSGLAEPETVDLASAVTISFEGVVPNVRVRYSVDYDQPFVRYTSLYDISSSEAARLHNGDTYTLDITYDDEQMRANGFIAGNTTASATVEGLPSYDFTLSGADDPLLAGLSAADQAEVEATLMNNLGSLQGTLLNDREGWVQWDGLTTALENEAMAVRDDDNGMDNLLFLVYHTTAPVRLVDGTVEMGDAYSIIEHRSVMVTPDGALQGESNGYINRYATMEEADAYIEQEQVNRLGENTVLTRGTAIAAEVPTMKVEETAHETPADLTAAATDSCAIGDMVPDYLYRIETWETMTDPYGNTYENVMALRAGDRARVDYRLNGRWNRFVGTLSTYNDAGTDAKMSLYVWGDGRVLYAVDAYQRSQVPEAFAIDVTGVQRLSIQTVCYGQNSGAWLFISGGSFEATDATEAPGQVVAPLSDALVADAPNVDIRAWSSMTADARGNLMRDCYLFDSDNQSVLRVNIGSRYTRFQADVMVMEIPYPAAASAKLEVLADGAQVALIEGITLFSPVQKIDIDVTGVDVLTFRAAPDSEDGGRVRFSVGNTLLTGEAQAEADAVEAAPTEYAPVDAERLKMFEGEYAAEELQSIACGDYMYIIVNKPCNYATAEFAAQRLGGTLAMPRTNRSNAAVTALIRETGSDRYWIGAQRKSPESETWVWTDGETMTDMSHWNSGEPNNSGGVENCAMIYRNGLWNDYPEDSELPFIMQVPAISGGLPEGAASLADLPRTGEDRIDLVSAEYDGAFDPLAVQFNADYAGWACFDLDGAYATLDAMLYVHPESHCNARATFAIFGDGKLLYRADNLKRSDPTRRVHVDVAGIKLLKVMTNEYAANENLWFDLTDAWLMPADEKVDVQAAELMGMEAVDAKEMGVRANMGFDAAGNALPGWIALDAADEGYVMYNLGGGYTAATGFACAGTDAADGETAQLRIYVDGQLAATLDGISRGAAEQPFEVNLTGASTLRLEVSRSGERWENIVYVAGLTVK